MSDLTIHPPSYSAGKVTVTGKSKPNDKVTVSVDGDTPVVGDTDGNGDYTVTVNSPTTGQHTVTVDAPGAKTGSETYTTS